MRRAIPHWRFLAYLLAIPAATALLWLLGAPAPVPGGWPDLLMGGFALATLFFLWSSLAMMRRASEAEVRQHAADNDVGRRLMPPLLAMLLLVVVIVVGWGLKTSRPVGLLHPLLPVVSLVLAWLMGGVVMALHYAHMWWGNGEGAPPGGLDFPHGAPPTYSDLLYFSINLSMTYQTSDVAIATPAMRRAVLGHCVAAFFFNISILALAFNLVAGLVLGRA